MARGIGWVGMIVVTVLLASAAHAAAPANKPPAPAAAEANPQFAAWSKFDVGASATHLTTLRAGEAVINTETVTKLVEKSDDQVVIELTVTVVAGGTRNARPAKKSTIRAKGDSPKKVADEKIEAAGETFDCKVYVVKETPADLPPDARAEVKVWLNDKVPGGVVQSETKASTFNAKSTLKSYSAK